MATRPTRRRPSSHHPWATSGRARRLEGAHRLVEVGARRRPLAACGEHDQIGGPTQVTTVRLLGSAGSRPPAT